MVLKNGLAKEHIVNHQQKLQKHLVSKEGIDAFIDLTQNWKNKNKAVTLIRTVTIGTDELE